MDIGTTLERARALYPERIAVSDGGRHWTYSEVAVRVDRLAGFFASRGLGPGDRIAALLYNGLPFLEAYYAAAAIGAVLVPLNWRLTAGELAYILQDSGARCLLADASLAPLAADTLAAGTPVEALVWIGAGAGVTSPVEQDEYERLVGGSNGQVVRESTEPTDHLSTRPPVPQSALAHLYYTSGTTGRPKGVMLTHENVTVHALAAIAELGLSDRDVWAHVAPMFHLADAWATFAITWVGGRHVMVPRFEPEVTLRAIETERVTLTNLVPTMLNLMVKHPARGRYDYSSLRLILSGGAPIAPEVVRAIADTFGCEYVQTYGMTETSPYLTLSLLKEHLRRLPLAEQLRYRTKTGRPFIAVELRVVRESGEPVAADEREVGEIIVRGPTVTPGYWNRPDATAEAFRDGWLRTGDLAVVDAEGYVTIVDRRKDMIITGGENVYSTEVENVLYRHPAVLEAAVYGYPDEIWGEVVAAAVVLRDGVTCSADELESHCAELAVFKRPRRIEFLPALPKTGSGKILKRALRP